MISYVCFSLANWADCVPTRNVEFPEPISSSTEFSVVFETMPELGKECLLDIGQFKISKYWEKIGTTF